MGWYMYFIMAVQVHVSKSHGFERPHISLPRFPEAGRRTLLLWRTAPGRLAPAARSITSTSSLLLEASEFTFCALSQPLQDTSHLG